MNASGFSRILRKAEGLGKRVSLMSTFAKSTQNKENTLQKEFHGGMTNMRISLRISIRQQGNQRQSDIVLI